MQEGGGGGGKIIEHWNIWAHKPCVQKIETIINLYIKNHMWQCWEPKNAETCLYNVV